MALIGTSDIRTWMGIGEGDRNPNEKLKWVASVTQEFCENYTNRALEARTYFQDSDNSYLDGNGKRWIYLPQYPVSYLSSVHIDADREWGSATLVGSEDLIWYSNTGKVVTEDGYFTTGRRNIQVHYSAGYAPIVGGTHNSAVSTYPIPYDLRQVMVEMAVESVKEGITALHSATNKQTGETRFMSLFGRNSFWRQVLDKYKKLDGALSEIWE